MACINSLTNSEGDRFLTTGSGDISKLIGEGWTYSASATWIRAAAGLGE